jgi:DNA ligase-1
MYKKIYKKDNNGNLRFLEISTFEDGLAQTSGIEGTDNPVVHRKFCKGKNIGKSNETSPSEQAILEGESVVRIKLTKGYFETIEEAEKEDVIMPMLACDYFKYEKKIDFRDHWYVQPKFDGMRCLAFIASDGYVKLMSRAGNEITTMDHIKKQLSKIGLDVILDGELYVHGENFQENMKYIKKYKSGLSERIDFHVYDVVEEGTFQDRSSKVSRIINSGIPYQSIKTVKTFACLDLEALKLFHSKFIKEGYEGTMLRKRASKYKINGRSVELLKYKDFKDLSLPILDIVPDDSDPTKGSPVYTWNGARDHKLGNDILGSGIRASHEKRREMLLNKQDYIGKIYEVRFFEYSDKGVPRFPITIGERLDK